MFLPPAYVTKSGRAICSPHQPVTALGQPVSFFVFAFLLLFSFCLFSVFCFLSTQALSRTVAKAVEPLVAGGGRVAKGALQHEVAPTGNSEVRATCYRGYSRRLCSQMTIWLRSPAFLLSVEMDSGGRRGGGRGHLPPAAHCVKRRAEGFRVVLLRIPVLWLCR